MPAPPSSSLSIGVVGDGPIVAAAALLNLSRQTPVEATMHLRASGLAGGV